MPYQADFKPTHLPSTGTARRVLIVGGVAGGASCAARLRRLDESVKIAVFDRGPYVAFANCGLPYYVGTFGPAVVSDSGRTSPPGSLSSTAIDREIYLEGIRRTWHLGRSAEHYEGATLQ